MLQQHTSKYNIYFIVRYNSCILCTSRRHIFLHYNGASKFVFQEDFNFLSFSARNFFLLVDEVYEWALSNFAGELNQQVETFAQELRYKTEESCRQKEEVTCLLAQVADLHKRVRQLTIENMDLAEKLQASQESQKQLTKEVTYAMPLNTFNLSKWKARLPQEFLCAASIVPFFYTLHQLHQHG